MNASAPPLAAAGNTPVNLAELLTRQAAVRPDAPALIQPFPERRACTWAELDRRVDAVASGLAGRGLIAGQRVALCGVNSIEFVVAYFAALRAGFVVVPINPQSSPVELARIIADSGARLLFGGIGAGAVELGGLDTVPLTAEGLAALGADAEAWVDSPRDPEALAVLLYTAGTSGESKAAMLNHRALLAHLDQISGLGTVTEHTVALAMLPLFHVFGLNAVLGSAAYAGATLVLLDGFEGFFDVLAAESVTNLPIAPAVLVRALHDDRCAEIATHVDTVISGAAPLSAETAAAFTARTGLRIDQGYGLTEAAPGVSVTIGADERALGHGFVGRPLPGVELRIGDGSDDGEPGEIWIRGANLFSGYWPGGEGGPDAQGWFATGDIGYLLDVGLFLVDRARELILVNGFNVFPAEVEEAINELPGVSGSAVVGRPDPRSGEQVVAFVTGTVDADAVRTHCAGRLAPFKRPAVVVIVEELPRGATGKVQKGALRRSLEGIDA